MAYADDVVFVERRLQDDEVFTSLVERTHKRGLEIDRKKDQICDSITTAVP